MKISNSVAILEQRARFYMIGCAQLRACPRQHARSNLERERVRERVRTRATFLKADNFY